VVIERASLQAASKAVERLFDPVVALARNTFSKPCLEAWRTDRDRGRRAGKAFDWSPVVLVDPAQPWKPTSWFLLSSEGLGLGRRPRKQDVFPRRAACSRQIRSRPVPKSSTCVRRPLTVIALRNSVLLGGSHAAILADRMIMKSRDGLNPFPGLFLLAPLGDVSGARGAQKYIPHPRAQAADGLYEVGR
jgi:hypothetical protein